MTRFERALEVLAVHEGGYSNHPDDPGGATMKGVTQRVYDDYRRRLGKDRKDVRYILDSEVKAIYRDQYWDSIRADDLHEGVAYCVFDAAVNSGPGRAVRWLQQVIGARVDGIVGNETIGLAQQMNSAALIDAYCDKRLAFMRRLRHWPTFRNGWTRRVEEVRARSKMWAKGKQPPKVTAPEEAKAEGDPRPAAREVAGDKGVWGVLTGLMGSVGALSQLEGPLAYGVTAVLVVVALTGVWMLVREANDGRA